MADQHRFIIEVEVIETGEYQVAFRAALAHGEAIWNVVEESQVVVRDGGGTSYQGIPNGVYCEGCEGHIVPGVRWPTHANSDGTRSWVERCDTCDRFESDEAARDRVLEWYGDAPSEITTGMDTPAGSSTPTPWIEVE